MRAGRGRSQNDEGCAREVKGQGREWGQEQIFKLAERRSVQLVLGQAGVVVSGLKLISGGVQPGKTVVYLEDCMADLLVRPLLLTRDSHFYQSSLICLHYCSCLRICVAQLIEKGEHCAVVSTSRLFMEAAKLACLFCNSTSLHSSQPICIQLTSATCACASLGRSFLFHQTTQARQARVVAARIFRRRSLLSKSVDARKRLIRQTRQAVQR